MKARAYTSYQTPVYDAPIKQTTVLDIEYQPSGGPIFNEMATVLDYSRGSDDKLNKYKGFLNEMRTFQTYV